MRIRNTVSHATKYVTQAIILGMAAAFLILMIWPEIFRSTPTTVQIQKSGTTIISGSGPVSYADAVDRAAPAVVNINTAKVVTIKQHPFFEDPFFRQFFGQQLDNLIRPKKQLQTSLGSGVIMSKNGYLLTNHHVIKGADTIQVSLRDGRVTPAKVVGSDPETDLAILKIDLDNLPAIVLGDSEKLRVGDVVLAIGNPFGIGQTVTAGIVGATGRNKLGLNTFENFIQTDAAINPGNSGGALVDAQGNLIGINTAIFSKSGGSQGIGFAIPISLAQSVLQDIIEHGRPLRGWLGIEANPVTTEIARSLGLEETKGIIIMGVLRDGPAHKAGLEPGDVIVALDDKVINDARQALMIISRHRPGDEVKMTIYRDGKNLTLKATAIERPS